MKRVSAAASLAIAIGGLAVSGASFAQSTWNWQGTASNPPQAGNCDPYTCTVDGVKATVSGWGVETAVGKFVPGAAVNDIDPYGLGIKSKDASTTNGVANSENTNSPNHAIDNWKGSSSSSSTNSTTGGAAYAELLAIDFDKAVNLSNVAVAWTASDSDAMIFRWDGALAPTSLTGVAANDLLAGTGTAAGWTLVATGQFATGSLTSSSGPVGSLATSSTLFSSHWLVSTALGQTTGANNDGFKVSAFTGNICAYTPTNGKCEAPPPPPTGGGSAPEPGTLALAAAAFVGMGISRRRKVAA